MLISDTYKFIFIAIPKTGTHSVRTILKEYSTDEHVGLDTTKAIFPHLNDTKKLAKYKSWKDYYTQEIADTVYNELRDDFETFGYSRELWKN